MTGDFAISATTTGANRITAKVDTARTLWLPAVNHHGGFGRCPAVIDQGHHQHVQVPGQELLRQQDELRAGGVRAHHDDGARPHPGLHRRR